MFTTEEDMVQMLTKWRKENDSLSYIDTIFLDEVHERTFNMDIILGYLKKINFTNMTTKVILASATLNESKFQSYLGNCSKTKIEGETHEVMERFCPIKMGEDHFDRTITTLREVLHERLNKSNLPVNGHILIFFDCIENIKFLDLHVRYLLSYDEQLNEDEFEIFQLHTMTTEEEKF